MFFTSPVSGDNVMVDCGIYVLKLSLFANEESNPNTVVLLKVENMCKLFFAFTVDLQINN